MHYNRILIAIRFDGYALDLLLQDLRQYVISGQVKSRPTYTHSIRSLEGFDVSAGIRYYANLLLDYEPQLFPDLLQTRESYRQHERLSTTQLSSSSLSDYDALCKSNAVSFQAAVYSAWAKLLSFLCGSKDIAFGAISSGRGIFRGSEDSIAPIFFNYPVRCKFSELTSNFDVLQNLEEQAFMCLKYPFTPMREILKEYSRTNGNEVNAKIFDSIVVVQTTSGLDDFDGYNNSLWSCVAERDDNDVSFPFDRKCCVMS